MIALCLFIRISLVLDPLATPLARPSAVEDLRYIRTELDRVHPNPYFHIKAGELDRKFSQAEEALPQRPTVRDLYLAGQRLMVLVRDSHSLLSLDDPWGAYLDQGGKMLPLRVRVDRNRLVVTENRSSLATPPAGSKVESINGVNASTLISQVVELQTPPLRHESEYLAGLVFVPFYWALKGPQDSFSIVYRDRPNGQRKTVSLAAVTPSEARKSAPKTPASTPEPFSYRILEDGSAAVLDWRECRDAERFRGFLKSMFADIRLRKVQNLIIDVRANPGGDGAPGYDLFGYIAQSPFTLFGPTWQKVSEEAKQALGKDAYIANYSEAAWNASPGTLLKVPVTADDLRPPQPSANRFAGRCFVLCGHGTGSNAMAFCSAIKDYHAGALVGEETGDAACGYGQFITLKLPNSGLELHVSTKRFTRPSGVDDGRGVLPDVVVHPDPLVAGRDAAMEAVLRTIRSAG